MGYAGERTDRGFRSDMEMSRFKHSPEVIEKALFELAAAGGTVTRACAVLQDQGIELSVNTLREWKRGPFRNRYQEIVSTRQKELDEVIARQQIENVINMNEAEQAAIKQTMAGLATADISEASNALRAIAQAKRYAIQNVGDIQSKPQRQQNADSLELIAKSLARLGLMEAKVEEEDVTDAEVVED